MINQEPYQPNEENSKQITNQENSSTTLENDKSSSPPTEEKYFEKKRFYNWSEFEEIEIKLTPERVVIKHGFEEQPSIFGVPLKLSGKEFTAKLYIRYSQKIDFWEPYGYGLYDIKTTDENQKKYLIKYKNKLINIDLEQDYYELDDTNKPIYNISKKILTYNKTRGIYIKIHNVAYYTQFFFNNVKGTHGKFYIVEDYTDINELISIHLSKPTIEDYYGKNISRVQQAIEDKKLNGVPPDFKIDNITEEVIDDVTNYKVPVFMIFKDSLFKSNAIVNSSNGMVSLQDDDLIISFGENETV